MEMKFVRNANEIESWGSAQSRRTNRSASFLTTTLDTHPIPRVTQIHQYLIFHFNVTSRSVGPHHLALSPKTNPSLSLSHTLENSLSLYFSLSGWPESALSDALFAGPSLFYSEALSSCSKLDAFAVKFPGEFWRCVHQTLSVSLNSVLVLWFPAVDSSEMFDWNDQEVCRIVFFSFSFFLVKLIQYVYLGFTCWLECENYENLEVRSSNYENFGWDLL